MRVGVRVFYPQADLSELRVRPSLTVHVLLQSNTTEDGGSLSAEAGDGECEAVIGLWGPSLAPGKVIEVTLSMYMYYYRANGLLNLPPPSSQMHTPNRPPLST